MSEMLKTTSKPIKVDLNAPAKAVIARPVGFAEREKAHERAKAYRESYPERRAASIANLQACAKAARERKKAESANMPPKPKKIWDNSIRIASIIKSEKLKIEISACTKNGIRCVSIREFYGSLTNDDWRPSRNGVVIPLVSPLKNVDVRKTDAMPVFVTPMVEFLSAVKAAFETAETMELADPENEVWATPKNKQKETKNEDQQP